MAVSTAVVRFPLQPRPTTIESCAQPRPHSFVPRRRRHPGLLSWHLWAFDIGLLGLPIAGVLLTCGDTWDEHITAHASSSTHHLRIGSTLTDLVDCSSTALETAFLNCAMNEAKGCARGPICQLQQPPRSMGGAFSVAP